ncbi:MAG: methyltransferase domain-containing protein [Proteobacteria bacterium]|nr:methyltransferase domain-containing protein [Pseudomonadota bacterium]
MPDEVGAASVTATTEAYYDSDEADSFYAEIWGGEDIHIGIYRSPDEDVAAASARTVETVAGHVDFLAREHRVLDVGAGYGGAGRFLATKFGCQVDCLNLSEVQNERNRLLTAQAGLADRVHVVHANFESIPGPSACYDAVWSQDAILHSGARERVLSEVARVLKPGGHFVFTDPMQTDDCPPDVLQPVLDRIHLDSLASPGFYRKNLVGLDFEEVAFQELAHQLRNHYARVRQLLEERRGEMIGRCGVDYVTRLLEGLGHWVNGADRGHLTWGIFHFRKHG